MEIINKIAQNLQEILEEIYPNSLSGGCYLMGHCMSEILNRQGFISEKVTGRLALHIKDSKNKYAQYGKFKLKGQYIGYYHTWCEVNVDNINYIIDPSIKYNKPALKDYFGIKLNREIPEIIFTNETSTFTHKYFRDDELERQSLSFLNKIDSNTIEYIITKTIENQNNI